MPRLTVIFADGNVGLECVKWLVDNFRNDIGTIITSQRNEIHRLASEACVDTHVFSSESAYLQLTKQNQKQYELGLLLWWPKIIKPSIIASAKHGFINTHPSLLPHNRGKHYNFWAIVESCPFGVSLHLVDEGIDCGALVAQKPIAYTWEDTGETLYRKATAGMKQLFIESYPSIRNLDFTTKPLDLSKGSIHYSSELEAASRINLDEQTTPRRLLNLLRARTFRGHPACSFTDDGIDYEVRIEITKKK